MKQLFIDIETYSSEDIKTSGSYRYMESPDFEILLVAYAYDDEPVQIFSPSEGDLWPEQFRKDLTDPQVLKIAFNAQFEWNAFKTWGFDLTREDWACAMVKSAYCGYPLSLDQVSKAMELGEKGKLSIGQALIRFFSKPDAKGQRRPASASLEKWELFKQYCINDVVSEREIWHRLEWMEFPSWEKTNYIIDQEMNSRGVLIDLDFAKAAVDLDQETSARVIARLKEITGVDNPNSLVQIKQWLEEHGTKMKELTKDSIREALTTATGEIREVLESRLLISKSSIKKYIAMENCLSLVDHRARGMFQFYGANRTGRWTSRMIQLQSLPQNHMPDLDLARSVIASRDFELANMLWPSIPNVLSELIRTAFIAPEGYTFAVADFSAIEARVISWVAQEEWRLEVFRTHGKIYEATASIMFNVPIESVKKGSELRQRGKTSELALGYNGGVEALKRMDREKRIPVEEMPELIQMWRKANPSIVQLWKDVEKHAKHAIKDRKPSRLGCLTFDCRHDTFMIGLPSGRKLCYVKPGIGLNRWGNETITYYGISQESKQWFPMETYGGKLVENIVQAIARDALAYSLQRLYQEGFKNTVMLVHDEVIIEVPKAGAEQSLARIQEIMGEEVPWMQGLPLRADGYLTEYYKKD